MAAERRDGEMHLGLQSKICDTVLKKACVSNLVLDQLSRISFSCGGALDATQLLRGCADVVSL